MIQKIQQNGLLPTGIENKNRQLEDTEADFKSTLKNFVQDVSAMQDEADNTSEAFVRGEITDLHQVTLSAQKARLSLELLLEIRNKVMDSYQEIMRMQL